MECTAVSLNRITSDPRREGEIISTLLSYVWSTAESLIKSSGNQCTSSDGHFPCPWNPRSVQKRYHWQEKVTSDTSWRRMRLTSHPLPTGISNVTGLISYAFNQPPRTKTINTLQPFVSIPASKKKNPNGFFTSFIVCMLKPFIVSCL